MSDIGQSAEAPASRTVVIDSDRALSSLRASLLSPSLPSEETRIVLDPNRFGSAAAEVEARVNALYADCGCEGGAFAVILTIMSMILWFVLVRPEVTWSLGVAGGGLLLAAAVVGKLLGLARSRILLWRLLSRLEAMR